MPYLRGHKWQIHDDFLIRTITKASGRSGKLAFCVVSVHRGNLFTSKWHRRVQLQPPGTWILNNWCASAIILETDQQRGEDETDQRRGNERERERALVLFIFSCFCDADLANVSERFLDKAFVDAPHVLEIFSDVSTPKKNVYFHSHK